MKAHSIGTRLTLWYAAALGAALFLFGVGMWLAMQHSLYQAVDESLRDRVEGVRTFIEEQSSWLSVDEMQAEFREHSVLGPGGDLFQVSDSNGHWLYRSDPLYDENVPIYLASELGSQTRFENLEIQGAPLRFLSQNVLVGDRTYTVQVAAPLHELQEGLREFIWLLIPAIPAVLLLASASGYWMSRRALRPVDEITRTAQSIGAENLSKRLAVPQTGDELQRLSQTLNDMIARLEASFQRVTRFTADASHELRTPLALIRTTAEVSLRGAREETEYREALQQILAEIERTSQLVENLLVIARADSGEAEFKKSRLDLVATVREACAQAVPLVQAKKLTMDCSVPEHPVWVNGDAHTLRRLFLILIDNAVKYTPSGGRVCVSLADRNGFAIGSVEDTGIGISEADLPYIFERFYRVDKARSRRQGGVGLGLAIGNWIAEAHQGKISVESHVGAGSTFRVELPLGNSHQILF